MEMRVVILGVGVAIPRTRLSVNAGTRGIIELRTSEQDTPFRMVIDDRMSIGSASGQIVASNVSSAWFSVNVSRHQWLHNRAGLLGKRAELLVKGTFLSSGEVDIKFSVYDNDGYEQPLIERAFLESQGFQINETRVRGALRRLVLADAAALDGNSEQQSA